MKKGYLDTLSSKKIIKDQSLLRHEDIRHQIHILPELQELIPPLLPDELAQLENNIRRDGCREALLVWETTAGILNNTDDKNPLYILVDGHNRYGICQRNSIDFRVNLKPFSGMDEVRTFMIENQLGRRNLTPEQTAYLRGLRYRDEKNERGKYDRNVHKGQNVPYAESNPAESPETASTRTKTTERVSTAQKLAKQFNVNEKTIKRDAEFAAGIEKLAPALKADVLSGKMGANKTLLQQLGKSTVADGSITSLDALTASPSPTPLSATSQTSPSAKRTMKATGRQSPETLRATLMKLAAKLSVTTDSDISLCDEIVACATQLKAALLENH